MRTWFTNNFVTFRTRVQFNLWFTVFKRPRLAELQQLIILFFTFLAKFQGNVWMINVLYLQFWHINCYLLCKNQQFSISKVRGVFLQTIMLSIMKHICKKILLGPLLFSVVSILKHCKTSFCYFLYVIDRSGIYKPI